MQKTHILITGLILLTGGCGGKYPENSKPSPTQIQVVSSENLILQVCDGEPTTMFQAILDDLDPSNADASFEKLINDGFSNPSVENYLRCILEETPPLMKDGAVVKTQSIR